MTRKADWLRRHCFKNRILQYNFSVNAEQKLAEKEKKQLLRAMKKQPHRPRTEWAVSLGWLNSKDQPNQTKITKRLKQLEADGLVIQIGHRYLIKNH